MSAEEPIEYYYDTMVLLMAQLGLIRSNTYFRGNTWLGDATAMRKRLMRYL